MTNLIHKMLPLSFRNYVSNNEFYRYFRGYMANRDLYRNKSKAIFVVGSPEHDNLGDHAITMAQMNFLKKAFPDYTLIEIVADRLTYNWKCLEQYSTRDDIFVLQGGGNFGIEYFREEEVRRRIITNFPNNKIILFPQTIFFGDTELGRKEFKKTQSIYSAHRDLTLVAREKTSYELMKEGFKHNKVLLTPDIVMSLDITDPPRERSGVLMCIRADKESIFNEAQKKIINDSVSKAFDQITYSDTCIIRYVSVEEREHELYSLWNQFKEAELVITDRLHGMIFAAITSTPCIALGNYNYKVVGSYEWIKHLGYIKFTNDISQIPELMDELSKIPAPRYNNDFSTTHYNQIIEAMSDNADEFTPSSIVTA
ncbi:pyruvyl transferase EpsI [Paenibacillus sp. PastF-1]|uniref:polysaccharide pyruvyl transferase family protein n=2 Tax=Paenibacillus TaxID=44249 RepID=UPI0024745175|nr:polysaccharide pyruvyl transferase family protein [Paenibacillus sp. PastM-3]MDF9840823.1 pyruvyl transferase EpsI [Paenibacillus sp. PastF-2]MDF9847406.1 pyruvyl transferase EpsI [Paenibacillus sp. PastM-2]MDF9854016.1 pyruvyl transferase EpsI [Paenibacillus sp. PastF-1]MDH6479289.1 pyruvyl transferase EpsI [Paenibacillus sp. PastH-2]MDH6506976.1 pyruvyl transferase EpsI [Paenibacillus sp. PastM-3]